MVEELVSVAKFRLAAFQELGNSCIDLIKYVMAFNLTGYLGTQRML